MLVRRSKTSSWVPVRGYSWHTLPHTLNSSSPRLDCLSPSYPSLYNLSILVIWLVWSTLILLASLLAQDTPFGWQLSPLTPVPTWPASGSWWLWTLPDGPASGYALPFVHNKVSPPPDLGAAISFLSHVSLPFNPLPSSAVLAHKVLLITYHPELFRLPTLSSLRLQRAYVGTLDNLIYEEPWFLSASQLSFAIEQKFIYQVQILLQKSLASWVVKMHLVIVRILFTFVWRILLSSTRKTEPVAPYLVNCSDPRRPNSLDGP